MLTQLPYLRSSTMYDLTGFTSLAACVTLHMATQPCHWLVYATCCLCMQPAAVYATCCLCMQPACLWPGGVVRGYPASLHRSLSEKLATPRTTPTCQNHAGCIHQPITERASLPSPGCRRDQRCRGGDVQKPISNHEERIARAVTPNECELECVTVVYPTLCNCCVQRQVMCSPGVLILVPWSMGRCWWVAGKMLPMSPPLPAGPAVSKPDSSIR
jgi:hypothetical protein